MKKNVLLVVLLLTVTIGCDKEPEPIAAFSISTTNADVGELIFAYNSSIDAFSYLWNDGDGNQTTDEDVILHYDNPGTYNVTLTAFSQSGEKQDVASETVTIEQHYGQVSFWQSGTPSYGVTTVFVNELVGVISADYPNGIQDCNNAGTANFTLTTGTHSFTASDGDNNWSGTVTIFANECAKIQLK